MSWDLVEESRKLIGIHSISQEGTREIAGHLAPFCRELGLQVTLQPSENVDEINLLASTLPAGSPNLCPDGLLWMTHLDTVPPGEAALWTETGGDPFRATIKGDRIYGLGSADTKLDFLCKLKALEHVGVKNIKRPFCLVGSYGEERALAGVKRLRESGLVRPRWALIGEPSELHAVTMHKGILYMRAVFDSPLPPAGEGRGVRVFEGRAAHGSTPHLGENAIFKAFQWLFEESERQPNLELTRIEGGTVHNIVPEKCVVEWAQGKGVSPSISFLKKFWSALQIATKRLEADRDPRFDPPITTLNVGVIRGEGGRIEIEFDFRLIPACDGNELFEIFHRMEESGLRVEVLSSNPPMQTDEGTEIVKRVREAMAATGLPQQFHVKAGNTEGAILSQMGAEAIVIGPGRSTGNIHKPNEYNEISQLKKAVEFYTTFLKGFC